MDKKKIWLISALVVLVGGIFAYEKFAGNSSQQPAPQPEATNDQQQPVAQQPVTATTSGLKDGTYVGDEASSIYGKAKAQITVVGGKITDVQFPEYPNDRKSSTYNSEKAMPVIKQEVIQAQSAKVNTVSGATETSASFIESVASAIAKAS